MRLILSGLLLTLSSAATAAEKPVSLFNGKDFTGWDGDTDKTWKIEDGAIVGGSLDAVVPRNEFLCTTKTYGDFELRLKFKLVGDRDKANAGVQFRTKRIPKHHEVSGYQADIGQGYWGALYDESRRNKVLAGPKPDVIAMIAKFDEWNDYVIRCEGSRIRLTLNGTETVDFTEADNKIEREGIIGLQVHGGAKAKAMYKDIAIVELKAGKQRCRSSSPSLGSCCCRPCQSCCGSGVGGRVERRCGSRPSACSPACRPLACHASSASFFGRAPSWASCSRWPAHANPT